MIVINKGIDNKKAGKNLPAFAQMLLRVEHVSVGVEEAWTGSKFGCAPASVWRAKLALGVIDTKK